ncbi:MAG: permease-like cell division protein FtsX [Lachnospiraceae bacterium]|nr:permease-like cell division protein FtsX [Lachnospiraceae bacterium]
MRPSSVIYAIRQGIKNIGRNRLFSLASIATMTACIFLFGVLFSVILNVDSLRRSIEEKVGVTVFFNEGTDDERIGEIGELIRDIDHVTDVTYTSAEEAWEKYKEEHFASVPSLAEGFKENPLANSASYSVFVDRVEAQSDVVQAILKIEGVRQVNQSSGAV